MSGDDDDDVLFECYYGGSFVVADGIKVSYGGGGVLSISSQPQSVMTCLMETLSDILCGKRFWYKFPFDDFSELRELCNGDEIFCKMCLAAKWIKQVEIFIEDAREGENVGTDNSGGDAQNVAAGDEGGFGDRFVDMEGIVKDNLAGFVDEEEHDHDEETPPNSDCEGGEKRHISYRKGCGVIRLEPVKRHLRRVYLGKELPKKLFWAVARSFNKADYDRSIEALKKFDEGIYEAVMQKNPENCSRAFFNCHSKCEHVSNNFSESYNNTINKAREMPLVEMLETVRRQAMIRIELRKKKAMKWKGKYSEKVANTIKEEKLHKKYCHVIPYGNGNFEVLENNHGFIVDMNAKTCACRRWSMTGIPCRYVLKIINDKKQNPEDFVNCEWYLTEKWMQIYSEPILGVNGIGFWIRSSERRIQPPTREEVTHGAKKKEKRKKEKNESPKKKKKAKGGQEQEPSKKRIRVTKEGRSGHCSKCGFSGHNARTCIHYGPPVFRRQKKKDCCNQPRR